MGVQNILQISRQHRSTLIFFRWNLHFRTGTHLKTEMYTAFYVENATAKSKNSEAGYSVASQNLKYLSD